MRQMLYGTLCGVVVFLALSWAITSRTVRAAVPTAPPEGRFEVIQLHPSHDEQWSGILDTETGCVWVYASQTPPSSPQTAEDHYVAAEGPNVFESVDYGTLPYTPLTKDGSADYLAATMEIIRVESLCDRTRVQALEAAAAR